MSGARKSTGRLFHTEHRVHGTFLDQIRLILYHQSGAVSKIDCDAPTYVGRDIMK